MSEQRTHHLAMIVRAVAAKAMVLTGAMLPLTAALAQSSAPVPPAPASVMAAKAYGALERNCASCHQAGRLDGREPGAGIANILALDEIARDPALVRPGVPDASRIYNLALTREGHHDAFNDPAAPAPLPEEMQALRDWIKEAGGRQAAACVDRKAVTRAAAADAVADALAILPPERARQTRFLSLAHLYNACMADMDLEALRTAIPALLERIGGKAPVEGWASAIDANRLVYRISLTSLGWRGEQWDKLLAAYPLQGLAVRSLPSSIAQATGSRVAVVEADWFAHAVQTALSGAFTRSEAAPDVARLWGLFLPQALAQSWRRPADIVRVAAEVDMPVGDLRSRLIDAPPGLMLAARQLRGGDTARRPALDRLVAALSDGGSAAPAPADRLELALVADKPKYTAGDVATFQVQASRDCFLTLVGVDRAGRATVLFPNELEPDNKITGGRPIRVPAETAAYRFRFKDKGSETIVAVCSETHRAPEGLAHDYDRLRFTVLGDWELFLREPPEMKEARRDDAATDIPRPNVPQRRRGRGRAPDAKAEPGVAGADVQTRTAVTIMIE